MIFTVHYNVSVRSGQSIPQTTTIRGIPGFREDTYWEASAKIAAGTSAPYEIIDIVPADGSIEDVSDQEMPWCHKCRGHYRPHRHSDA